MRFRMVVCTVAATAALLPASAGAVVVTVTYSGGISGGLDETGIFIAPGTSFGGIGGSSYVATYRFDLEHGGLRLVSPTENMSAGGDYWHVASPSLGATLTINGRSFAFAGQYTAQIYGYNSGFQSTQFHQVTDNNLVGGIQSDTYMRNTLYGFVGASLPATIDRPFTYDANSHDVFRSGNFDIRTIDNQTGAVIQAAHAIMSPDKLTYTVSVPEPSTWVTMAAGFGLIGWRVRRRAAPQFFRLSLGLTAS